MKSVLARLILLLALAPAARAAEDTIAQTEFDATLKDGSEITGIAKDRAITIITEFGETIVPLKVLRRIEFDESKGQILFMLLNKDEIAGVPKSPNFGVRTKGGDVTVPFTEVFVVDVITFVAAKKETLAKGLQVHLTFDEDEALGDKILNHTRLTPSAQLVEGARANGELILDGDGDHVTLPNHESFEQATTITISIWTKLKSFGPGGYANEHGYLVNKGDDMWWNPAWCLGYSKKSGAGKGTHPGPLPALFVIGTEIKGGGAECRVNTTTKLDRDQWYHLVGTYDGEMARIYLNGRLEAEKEYEGRLRKDRAPLHLGGGRLGSTSFGNHFTTDATIDNLRIYDRALNHGEVRLLNKLEKR